MLEKEDLKQIETLINTSLDVKLEPIKQQLESLEPIKQQLESLEPIKRQLDKLEPIKQLLDRMEFGLKEIKVELKRYIELREKRRLLHIKAMSI